MINNIEHNFFVWEEKNLIEQKKNYENKNASEINDIMNDIKIPLMQKDLKSITPIKSGIYKIINKVNGKYYVGRSQNIKKRWREHKNKLRNNKHFNEHLQSSWNSYGEQSFEFILVEELDNNKQVLIDAEEKYIKIFLNNRKNGNDDCYNLSISAKTGVSYGKKPFNVGKKLSDEHRKNISKGLIGNKNTKGKSLSDEHKKSIALNSKKGLSNPAFNHTVYNFVNKYTNEKFTGTLYELMKKVNITINSSLHRVIKGKRNHYKGWMYIQQ
jgi:group I intron endonuclease